MAINCPLRPSSPDYPEATDCLSCFNNRDGKCHWFYPGKPLNQILTVEERLTILERQTKPETPVASPTFQMLDQLKGLVMDLQNRLNDHVDRAKKRKDKL